MRMKWGSADVATALDAWEPDESRQGYQEYTGERPPKGLYRWRIDRLQAGKSSGGHRQVIVHLVLDAHTPETKQYSGKYMRDYIIIKEDTGFRIMPLLNVLGVTAKQLLNNLDVKPEKDDAGFQDVIKIGNVDPNGFLLFGRIWPDRDRPEYDRIAYVRAAEADGDDAAGSGGSDDGDGDADGDPPF